MHFFLFAFNLFHFYSLASKDVLHPGEAECGACWDEEDAITVSEAFYSHPRQWRAPTARGNTFTSGVWGSPAGPRKRVAGQEYSKSVGEFDTLH